MLGVAAYGAGSAAFAGTAQAAGEKEAEEAKTGAQVVAEK
jgi:hypothetical protein